MNNLHVSDKVKQSLFPTIMIPQKTELLVCDLGQTRLLMATDGLYIETRQSWGSFVKKLWHNFRATPLPYGSIEGKNDFKPMLYNALLLLNEQMIREAAEYAEQDKEWAGFIVYDGKTLTPWTEIFTATKTSVDFKSHQVVNLPENLSLVADIHSHNTMQPFFSPADDASDMGKVKISIVLGNYRKDGNQFFFDWKARYCIQGFFFDVGGSDEKIDKEIIEKHKFYFL